MIDFGPMVIQRGVPLRFEDRWLEGVQFLRIEGSIDVQNYRDFERRMTGVIDEGARDLVLELSSCPFISSMGVGVLVRTYRRLQERGGVLVLLDPSPGIRQVLTTLMLDRRLPIAADDAEATRFIRREEPGVKSISGG